MLEVGTDGIVNQVDRDVNDAEFLEMLTNRIAAAFRDLADQMY